MASLRKRSGVFYIQYYVGTKQRRLSLQTSQYQVAKEKLRQFESAEARGEASPFPTQTPISHVLTKYVADIRSRKTPKCAQTEIYYLRDAFGPVCDAVTVTSRRLSRKMKRKPGVEGHDLRRRAVVIEAPYFEAITTAQVAAFVGGQVQSRGLSPKTANHFRQILTKVFNWATNVLGLRLVGGHNPAARLPRYKERAPEIRYLTLHQIDEQLDALRFKPQLQTMVAMLIFAGLRREELLWLTLDDIDLDLGLCGIIRVRAKTINGQSWQPKTGVNRTVPIGKSLRAILDRYRVRASHGRWYFPSPDGKHWDPDNFSQDLRVANKEAHLAWGALDYRHTFGSQLAMKGESLFKISKLMGNSPEICRRHYAAIAPESLLETVDFPAYKPPVSLVKAG